MSQKHSPPVWSMGKGKRSTDPSTTAGPFPGPGAYDSVDVRRRSSPGWRIGKAERSAEARSETPGPGKYDVTKSEKRGPQYVFGGQRHSVERSQTPGPGAYNNTTILRATDLKPPSFSIRGRLPTKDETATPGPGTYDQSSRVLHQRPAAVRLGTSKRDDIYNTQNTPGPGQYLSKPPGTLDPKNGPKWGFGTAERAEITNTSKSAVGPGAYSINSSFDEKRHGAIMIARRPDSAIFNAAKVPGPGAYTVGLFAKLRAPSFRIGTAPRYQMSKEQVNVPGPGHYSVSPEKQGVNVVLASSTRKPLNDKIDTPGPGAYAYDLSTNKGPKYGMIPRRDEVLKAQKDRETPGPGTYESSVDSIKAKGPKYGIGNGNKDGLYRTTDGPGPGMYDTRSRITGPKYGFGTDKRNKSVNSSFEKAPGPGAYNVPPAFADYPRYALGNSKLKISL